MAIEQLNENVEIIQTLTDYPNTDGNGMTADELKKKFDEGSRIIKGYLNEVVVPAINDPHPHGLPMDFKPIINVSSMNYSRGDQDTDITVRPGYGPEGGRYLEHEGYEGEPIMLRGIAAGVEDADAVNVKQLNAKLRDGIVRYTAQDLTDEQKAQARKNIDAIGHGIEELVLAKKGDLHQGIMFLSNRGHCDDDDALVLRAEGVAGENVRMRGIAPGIEDTDAVTKKQMKEAIAQEIENIDAAQVNDTRLGADAWSSKNTVDKLCPAFTESGSVVTCAPVEGYPLQVVSHIEPIQEGSGDPTPEILGDNIFNVGNACTLEVSDEQYMAAVHREYEVGVTYRFTVNASITPDRITLTKGVNENEWSETFYNTNVCEYTFNQKDYDLEEVMEIRVEWDDGAPEGVYDGDGCTVCPVIQKSNIRPISGHSAVKLWRGGKNLFDFVGLLGDENYTNTKDGVTVELNTGMVHLYGTNTHTSYTNPLVSSRFPVGKYPIPAGTYTLGNLGNFNVQLHDKELAKNFNYTGTFTTTKTLYLVNFFTSVNYAGETVDMTFPLMMVAGTEAPTAYEPYRGETFTAELGQDVYGGSFDWASGVLTIDAMLLNINPDKISFSGTDETGLAYTAVANQNGLSMDITQRGLCNRLTYVNVGMGASDIGYSFHPGGAGLIRFRFPGVTSLEEAKAWVLENPLQLYYKLAEPITIQLTPQEILALSGENTLYSDTGDTEVTGRADPVAIIEAQQAVINSVLNRVTALEAAAVDNI